jgi:hypothetical protein
VGFHAALILKAVGISLEKFSWLDGKSKAENGSRSGSRRDYECNGLLASVIVFFGKVIALMPETAQH